MVCASVSRRGIVAWLCSCCWGCDCDCWLFFVFVVLVGQLEVVLCVMMLSSPSCKHKPEL